MERRMHVLIVERDAFVRAWWRAENESIGAELTFVADLGAARDTIARARPRPRCVIAEAGSLVFDAQGGDRLIRRLASLGVPVLVYSASNRWVSLARLVGTRLAGALERPFGLADALRRAFDVASSPEKETRPWPPTPPAIAASLG
jgi:CheY-like chemotaxis protein